MRIVLDHVSYSSGNTVLIDDVSCELEEGVAVLVMGPSGSGKTLLMKVMASILPPSSGEIRYGEKALSTMSDRELQKIRTGQGFVFQDAALWQNLTVYQNLALPLEYHYPRRGAAQIRSHILALCRKMDFQEDLSHRPTLLSAGERKVASILRALVLDPHTVYMDEPSAGLDSASSAYLLDILKDLKRKGKTLIIGGHDSQIASMIADRILVMDEGRLVAYDTVQNLVRTDNRRIRAILSDVFDLSSTYDADILDILGSSDGDPFA
ncbi:MAG: ATP-binding cassette domain-containing protein [Alkalispirochaeta sp.]|jgi:ABC-type multidrug transport system ATPase subunit